MNVTEWAGETATMIDRAPTIPKHCQATRHDGQPCGATPQGNGWCFTHDPDRAADRANAYRRGGENRSTTARLEKRMTPRLRGVVRRLEGAMAAVEAGSMDPRTGTALATLARALIAAYEAGELELRVAALEQGAGDGAWS